MRKVVEWMFDVTLRPPRASYNPAKSIAVVESCRRTLYVREGVEFTNPAGLKLIGSIWREQGSDPTACVIFLHSLGTNQFECVNLVPFLCTPELALFAFDFSGSGRSEGDFIPLVGNGSQDVFAAADFVRSHYGITQLCLWGRSMGAAIGLDVVSMCNDFACIVADSAFASTEDIVYDQAKLNGFPKCLVKIAEPYLKRQAKRIVGESLDLRYPLKDISFAVTPVLMGHGKRDMFVPLAQARSLFDQYGATDKQLYVFNAKHNTVRPNQWYETAARFVYRKLGIEGTARLYDAEYRGADLHIGDVEEILVDIQKMRDFQEICAQYDDEHSQQPTDN